MTDETREKIRAIYAETGSIRQTRIRSGHARKTIRRALGLVPEGARARGKPQTSKLDPYKPHLARLILEDKLTAILAFEELREMGYEGCYSLVKRHVATIRPRPARKPTTVVEHPPGKEGQVDWSPYWVFLGSERVQVHAFSLVLPFSRYMFVRFTLDEKLETLLACHEQAFDHIDRVPRRMSYDNMTTVGRHVGPDKIWINPRFASWAEPYGFKVHLIAPGKPNQHGSVERPFSYIENNCLRRRRGRFTDLEDLNAHARWWCAEVANVRVHGSTRRLPIDLLEVERSFMEPLPSARPEPFESLVRRVRTDFCVAVQTNAYSVSPRLVGREVTVHLYAKRLEVVVDGEVHAVHARSRERHQRFVLEEHEAEFQRVTPSRRLLEGAFLRLGGVARTYYDGLCAQRGRGAGYHLKRILCLADRHGNEAVVSAMAHAAEYGNYSAEAVSRVLNGRSMDRKPPLTQVGEAPMPPERVRRWLEGSEVETRDLEDYDRLLDQVPEGEDGQ
jgi:transposase